MDALLPNLRSLTINYLIPSHLRPGWYAKIPYIIRGLVQEDFKRIVVSVTIAMYEIYHIFEEVKFEGTAVESLVSPQNLTGRTSKCNIDILYYTTVYYFSSSSACDAHFVSASSFLCSL